MWPEALEHGKTINRVFDGQWGKQSKGQPWWTWAYFLGWWVKCREVTQRSQVDWGMNGFSKHHYKTRSALSVVCHSCYRCLKEVGIKDYAFVLMPSISLNLWFQDYSHWKSPCSHHQKLEWLYATKPICSSYLTQCYRVVIKLTWSPTYVLTAFSNFANIVCVFK